MTGAKRTVWGRTWGVGRGSGKELLASGAWMPGFLGCRRAFLNYGGTRGGRERMLGACLPCPTWDTQNKQDGGAL